jgi:dipeptidase D
MSSFDSLQPQAVWQIFAEMSKVPRGSGNETAVMAMLEQWAARHGLQTKRDAVGNMLVTIGASKGHEGAAPLLVQGHVDMVCEKNTATKHDFTKDPIKLLVDGDWVTGDGTTLGADTPIGVAMGLALGVDNTIVHGPIEVLLTVDEERGLTGAAGVKAGFFSARRMINLDSEEDDAIFIGCAGGRDSMLTLTTTQARAPKESTARKVSILGLKGGHSGLDIHRHRGNAIKIITRGLQAAAAVMDVRVVTIVGGSMRNAIPREALATVVIPRKQSRQFKKLVEGTVTRIKAEELAGSDNGLEVKVTTVKAARACSLKSSKELLNMLTAIPNGVTAMSQAIDGLVETSTNLGVVATTGAKVQTVCCSRSSVMSSLDELVGQHAAIGHLACAAVEQPEGYPGWQPNLESKLLAVTRRMYSATLGHEAELKAIHAGLECGLLTEKYPDLDIVSFGPNILGAHSPDERVSIPSVQKIWKLFSAVVTELS